MEQKNLVIVVSVLIGIASISCSVSAVRMPVDTFRIALEKNGTPFNVFADFSAVCYGHSFLNVAGDNHFLNVTPENPVPLNKVLDLQVQCNPTDRCTAQTYGKGDPERSEWCELNGSTTGGDPIQANITAENLKVNCSLSSYSEKWCEIRFNIPSSGIAGSELKRSAETTSQPAVTPAQSRNNVESIYCIILSIFGARC
jgi:hypothetical protein